MPRRLCIEKRRCGRQGEARHSSRVETAVMTRSWATIAHAPAPAIARPIPVAQLIVVAMIVRTSRLLNARSRVSSAPWTIPGAVNRNASDSTANSGCTSGSPYIDAIGQEAATPISVSATPRNIPAQNAVERSSSLRAGRWTRTEAKPKSTITSARLANTSASAANPTSNGDRKRAITIAVTKARTWIAACEIVIQPTPRTTRSGRSWPPRPWFVNSTTM